uniref:Uncharacterized protein n=1 Tax=Candidatus Kentrum sp. FW TaxID=2126338 RepID=A0A450SHV6_9GAMM|nr:MAG: hypothetical protein BECKFW1821A_GA0114235_10397 [Candidatus Kentron sp. FW]
MDFVVLRTMLGFTPPEWAYVASERIGLEISQNAARTLDRKIRATPVTPVKQGDTITDKRIRALVETACQLLIEGAPKTPENIVHRLDKADTKEGVTNLRHLANFGVPYAMLLYERYLGRPFAAHRDSVSNIVGDVLESAIEPVSTKHRISLSPTNSTHR